MSDIIREKNKTKHFNIPKNLLPLLVWFEFQFISVCLIFHCAADTILPTESFATRSNHHQILLDG